MWIIAITSIILIALAVLMSKDLKVSIAYIIATVAILSGVIIADYSIQTIDYEVWSGKITEVKHTEDWDEHIPAKVTSYTDSDGKTKTKITPARTEHHYAYDSIKTSDEGWINVSKSPDGKTKFNDKYPNTTQELSKHWIVGTPSASVHSYTNKVQASYSILKHKELEIDTYTDLPDYPKEISNYIELDRLIGEVPNKAKAKVALANWNTDLNKFIPDPENPDKMRSWKQVNVIFVNVGANKGTDYGFALQDKWENGNKNDFIISFSMNPDGKINWVYPFSWSHVEILNLEIKDFMLNQGLVKDFEPIINETSKLVADGFERKQFAEFNYLQIETSKTARNIILIISLLAIIAFAIIDLSSINARPINRNRSWR
jgi:hypothetical protein